MSLRPHRGTYLLLAEVREAVGMALGAITSHKLRSSLTLLGVLVGVFSIIVVMTAIRVLQHSIEDQLHVLGTHTFQIGRFPAIRVDDGGAEMERYFRRRPVTLDQARRLAGRATLARHVGVRCPFGVGEVASKNGKTNPTVDLFGVLPASFETRNWVVEEGRALMESDMTAARDVCVLGASLAKRLFPRGSAVNETVKFQGYRYTVVGVLEAKGGLFGQDEDNFLAIPVTTGLDRYGRETSMTIQVQALDEKTFDDALEEARGLMRTIRKVPPGEDDDFEVYSNDTLINQFRAITFAVRAGAGIISSIALLAAGIGIMNIMLVSVTERTREIGVRRAIGAKKRNIMTQFIMEAIALCQIGGLLGVVLGIAFGNVVALLFDVPPVIPVDWVIIGLVICSAVGIIFGTYPAWKAANLDPIESLRYE